MNVRPQNRPIIADPRRSAIALAALALAAGTFAAWHYASLGLTLSHYDAKAHLVVARRILDGINPGWVQIGAVWLPLPHLLNMLPAQIDGLYRTGLFAVVLSVLSFAATAGLLARIVHHLTGSAVAALLGAVAFAARPDVLYLQSTPMTESLLMALVSLAAWLTILAAGAPVPGRVRAAGLAMAGACMTRYEAWPVTAALLAFGAYASWRQGTPCREAGGRFTRLAAYPVLAILGFLVLGRASTGSWFTTSGFFVPEGHAMGSPIRSLASVWWGTHQLTSLPLASLGLAGLVLAALVAWRDRRRADLLVPIALAAAAALPIYAFYTGHPFRIRYMTPLVPAVAVGLGLLAGLVPQRLRWAAAAVTLAAIVAAPPPLSTKAPMVLEAQWDTPNRLGREQVTAYLRRHWDGEMVLASMGSLAHYMQELSVLGFRIRDFVHEGNGPIWAAAVDHPARHVEWMLVEEQAEGGDALAQRARAHPGFLDGMARVAEGGGVALYRRVRSGT